IANSLGKPRQRTSVGVVIFFSMIRSYFCFLVAAFSPCQGSEPRQKYSMTYPRDSMSSRRDCSTPRWVLMLAYRAVPVKFLFSRYGMWKWVLGSRYFLARPKSMTLTWL